MPSRLLLSTGLALSLATGLSACGSDTTNRGFIPDKALMAQVRPGVDNENSVAQTLGRPTAVSNFDTGVWYYISMTEKRRSFFDPEITDQQVFAVSFGDNGLVSDVETFTLADAIEVDPVDRKTPTRGKELGIFQQLFGNIGRFSGAGGRPGGGPGGGGYQN